MLQGPGSLPPVQDGKYDAAVRVDMPHVLLQLPLAAPPEHPEGHPVDEPAGQFRDYACRAGGPFAPPAPPGGTAATTCSAATLALYISNDGGADASASAGNISRRLPALLLPSLTLHRTRPPPQVPPGGAHVQVLLPAITARRSQFIVCQLLGFSVTVQTLPLACCDCTAHNTLTRHPLQSLAARS